jgi:hypothetical protein
VRLVGDGDPSKLDMLVVGEGYRREDLTRFHEDADRLVRSLKTVDAFEKHWSKINIVRQDIVSRDTGIADPAKKTDPVTAFEMSFGVDGTSIPRRCVISDSKVQAKILSALEPVKKATKADVTIFLVNVDEYGGCALPWFRTVTATRNEHSPFIVAHELGHTLFGLDDEYGGRECSRKDHGPNVSKKLDALPWKDMLTVSKVPNASGSPAGTIGAFDGAGRCDHGVYRPTETCLMRDVRGEMCAVCAKQVDRFFESLAQR